MTFPTPPEFCCSSRASWRRTPRARGVRVPPHIAQRPCPRLRDGTVAFPTSVISRFSGVAPGKSSQACQCSGLSPIRNVTASATTTRASTYFVPRQRSGVRRMARRIWPRDLPVICALVATRVWFAMGCSPCRPARVAYNAHILPRRAAYRAAAGPPPLLAGHLNGRLRCRCG